MKQFMVLIAVLPLMLVFFLQFSLDQINSSRIAIFTDLVYAAKEEAKQEGCFTGEIKEELRSRIAERLNIPENSVTIEADSTPVYRISSAAGYTDSDWERGLIHYKVSADIGKAMAGARLFGIREKDNVYRYVIESYAASELLP